MQKAGLSCTFRKAEALILHDQRSVIGRAEGMSTQRLLKGNQAVLGVYQPVFFGGSESLERLRSAEW